MLLRLIALGGVALLGNAVEARGVSPYLPLQMSPEIERQIERLLILADQPVLQRPIAAATVLSALPRACERDLVLCQQVERYLSGYMRTAGIPHASLTAAATSSDSIALANRHGMRSDSAYEASISAYLQPSDYVLLSGGVLAYEGETTPTGTLVSMGFEYAQVDVGFRDHWLSPFTDSSMALSTEAATMPSVTISNYTPLTRWRLRYELFVAEMSESSNIAFQGGFTSGNPLFGGIHVSIEPFDGWSFGVTRLLQFGGGERDSSFSSFLDALINPSDYDNTGTDADFGNQVASFMSQLLLPGPVPLALYFEYAGEDTSTLSNLRLGNSALSVGLHVPTLGQQFDLTVELSEWQNAWYVHSIYQDGLRHEGNVVGHWGADHRALNDAVGARSVMARLGWLPRVGGMIEATYRSVDNEDYGAVAYQRGWKFEVRYSRPWQRFLLGGEIDVGEDVFGDTYSRISAFARF
jgi:Capsule assembly protein Wzi